MQLIKLRHLIIAGSAIQLLMSEAMAQPTCNFMKTAEEFLARRYPEFDPAGLKAVVTESGDLWELSYELPAGVLGGTPVVTIDKRTCVVISSRHEQ